MKNQKYVQQVAIILGCGELTADSLIEAIVSAIEGNISEIDAVTHDVYKKMKITTDNGMIYYVDITSKYVIDAIHVGTEEGEIIYREIE